MNSCENMAIKKFSYDGPLPDWYVCAKCGVAGVRLWRGYQESRIQYLCANCAEERGRKCHENEPNWVSSFAKGEHDSIGWCVPAVPDEEGEGCWGYSSVPQKGVAWWYNLPVQPGGKADATAVEELKKKTDFHWCACDHIFRQETPEAAFWATLKWLRGTFTLVKYRGDETGAFLQDGEGRCPICAVAKCLTGDPRVGGINSFYAGKLIGLPYWFIRKVTEAADDVRGHDGCVRTRLLDTLGLLERSDNERS